MAKLIVKRPYIKCTGSSGAAGSGGYLHYIGTREHGGLIPNDRPPTRKQEQLITKLLKGSPGMKELFEYEDYHIFLPIPFATDFNGFSVANLLYSFTLIDPQCDSFSALSDYGPCCYKSYSLSFIAEWIGCRPALHTVLPETQRSVLQQFLPPAA